MARHRNIRSMNYSDECDAYDDVYGHSVEEDFCMSPSDAAFIYDREGSRNQQRIGQFFKDIREEDESDLLDEYQLSEDDKIKLTVALKELKETLGSSATKKEMAQTLLDTNYDVSKAANILLDKGPCIQIKPIEKKEKDDNLKFHIPKLSKFNTKVINFNKPVNLNLSNSPLKPPLIVHKSDSDSKGFNSLTDLSNSHFKKISQSFGMPENSFEQVKTNNYLDNYSANNLTRNFSDLSISKNDHLKCDKNETKPNEFENVIDLTLAVKNSTSSIKSKTRTSSNEDFEMPFVECDSSEPKGPVYPCSMSIEYILNKHFNNVKKPSVFGKIICKNYRKRTLPVVTHRSCYNSKVIVFDFKKPSPDDVISQYLKR